MSLLDKFCPVGETIEHFDKTIMAVETECPQEGEDHCKGCLYDGHPLRVCIALQCDPESRADGKYVIFKEAAKDGGDRYDNDI